MMRTFIRPAFIAMALCLGFMSQALAFSHGSIYRYIGQATGIELQLPQHGQLPVLAKYRAPVWNLAQQVAPADPVIAQLSAYAHKQYAACWYGLFPAGMADVESPFHLCSHGYLAAGHAMLVRLTEVAAGNPAVASLSAHFAADMRIAAASPNFSLCINSGQQLNTVDIIHPRWPDIANYTVHSRPAQLVAGLAMFALMLASGLRATRRKPATAMA